MLLYLIFNYIKTLLIIIYLDLYINKYPFFFLTSILLLIDPHGVGDAQQ